MTYNGFKLVAFDMDGVLTSHPSSWRFVHERLGIDNYDNLYMYRNGRMKYHQFLDSDIGLWMQKHPGITKEDIMSILRDLPIRDDLERAIGLMRESGAKVVIISGGISWLSEILNEKVAFDEIYANVVNTDSTGKIVSHGTVVVEPKSKELVLQKVQEKYGILPEETASVGDSLYDSSMFKLSRKGVAFSSTSKELENIADICIDSGRLVDLYTQLFVV